MPRKRNFKIIINANELHSIPNEIDDTACRFPSVWKQDLWKRLNPKKQKKMLVNSQEKLDSSNSSIQGG
jgi:hypothetical protein